MKISATLPLSLMIAGSLSVGAAQAQTSPSPIQVFVDGVQVGTVNWRTESGFFVTDFARFASAGNYEINVGQSVLDPDPIFDYGIGLTNESATQKAFRFVYDLPFDPSISLPTDIRATLGGTIVDTNGNGVQLLAPSNGSVQTVTFNPGNVATSIDLGASFSQPGVANGTQWDYGRFFAPGPDGTTFAVGPSGTWNGMRVVTEFTLSPRDSLSLDGFVTVKPIPEPETVLLIALGLGFLALNGARKARVGQLRFSA